MSETKVDKGAIANAWLSNKYVVIVLVAILAGVAIRWLLPSIFKRAKEGFSNTVDEVRGSVASIIGSPETQVSADREADDVIQGLFTTDDRALSDIYDATLGRVFN